MIALKYKLIGQESRVNSPLSFRNAERTSERATSGGKHETCWFVTCPFTFMQKFDSIIFDLDGTLWDSSGTVTEAWTSALKKTGYPFTVTKEKLRSVTGMKFDLIFDKLFPGLEPNDQQRLLTTCGDEELSYINKLGGELYDTGSVLEELHKHYKLFIVSNCQSGYIEGFYSYHNMQRFFQDQECAGNTGKSKAENLRMLIKRNDLTSPIFVGDTQGDRDAAAANNVPFVFAAYGFGTVDSYDHKIDNLGELVSLLK